MWFRVPYFDESFCEAVADQPVTMCRAGRGTLIEFQEDVYDTLAKSLESNGFEFWKEYEPRKGTHKTWHRYTDVTFASLRTSTNSNAVRFHCGPPQHKGEPRTKKAPSRHPSQRLPLSKRPVLELDQLAFANLQLQQKSKYFHDLAERIAGQDWHVQRYKDIRNSAKPFYVASWQSTNLQGRQLQSALSYRSMGISLKGHQTTDGKEEITSVSVVGRWAPRQGWAAAVTYHTLAECRAIVGPVDPQEQPFDFDASSSDAIYLSDPYVSVEVRDDLLHYRYRMQRLGSPSADYYSRERTDERRTCFFSLFASAEELRDMLLEDIEIMREQAREDISQPGRVAVTDYTDVRSDNPPREAPPGKYAVPEAVQQKLVKEVLRKLGNHDKLVRENYVQMYAALIKALPLHELPWRK
jgi:hypothetical protein